MSKITVAFFGHRELINGGQVVIHMIHSLERLLNKYEEAEFLVGREGQFDSFASTIVRGLRQHETQKLILILPYETAEYKKDRQYLETRYTKVEICQAAAQAHYKASYSVRNKAMANRADLILCWIERESGGAWAAVKYAKKMGKKIINLSLEEYENPYPV